MGLRFLAGAAAFLTVGQASADATHAVQAFEDLPAAVAKAYETACTTDSWISGKRQMAGSSTATFADGTQAFLLVCGDAASAVPFAAIVLPPAGEAREAKFNWHLRGKSLDDAGLSNARFGAGDIIVSRAHESATCEPTYTHVWDGAVFQLIRVNRRGCRAGE
jgi:hypothetical protein